MSLPQPNRLLETAVVGVGIRGQGMEGSRAFIQRLFRSQGPVRPPGEDRDPGLLASVAADEAYAGAASWDPGRSGIFLGLDEDNEALGLNLDRILAQRFGFRGGGEVCSAGALSGNRALATAVRLIELGFLDGALVGAVEATANTAGAARPPRGGLAVFLALRRRDYAERDGDHIWAVLAPGPVRPRRKLSFDPGEFLPGRGQSVSGLLQVAVGCVMADHHVWFCREDRSWQPILDRTDGIGFLLEVETPWGVGTCTDFWRPFRPGPLPRASQPAPRIATYSGATLDDLIQRVLLDERGGEGRVRAAILAKDERELQEQLAELPQLLQRGRQNAGWLDLRTFFSPAPILGKVASVFTPVGAGYLGMGRELLLGIPFLPMLMRHFVQDLSPADWVYQAHRERRGDPIFEFTGTMVLSQAHAAFTRDILGLRPDVAMGLSLGEMNALIAYGAWGAMDGQFERMQRDGLYSRLMSGSFDSARAHWGLPEGAEIQWRNWTVFGPVGKVLEQVASEERAYVAIVFSPIHCVLSGDAEACRRVLTGCRGLTAVPTLGSAAHTPVMARARATWYRHYHRPTRPVPGIEFHSSHFGGPYELTPDRVAEALTGQVLMPQDFPAAAWRAWDRGVRVFVEHGPRSLLTSALKRLLPKDEGVFLAMDAQGENALQRAIKVALELWCRGVQVNLAQLESALGHCPAPEPSADPLLDVAASLFAASLERMDSLHGAYQACLQDTRGRFLEFLGMPPEEDLDL